MAVQTQLSLSATPSRPYSFVAKTEAAVVAGAARQPKIFRYRDEEDILFLISRFIQVVEGPLN